MSTTSRMRSRTPCARRPYPAHVNTLPEGDGVPVIRAFHHHPRGSARSHREHLRAKRSSLNREDTVPAHSDPSPGAADPAAARPSRMPGAHVNFKKRRETPKRLPPQTAQTARAPRVLIRSGRRRISSLLCPPCSPRNSRDNGVLSAGLAAQGRGEPGRRRLVPAPTGRRGRRPGWSRHPAGRAGGRGPGSRPCWEEGAGRLPPVCWPRRRRRS